MPPPMTPTEICSRPMLQVVTPRSEAARGSVCTPWCHHPMSGEGWAIFALPPGSRDLGSPELWERSLNRSRRRREAAAARRANRKKCAVPTALVAATLIVPAGQVARAQDTVATSAVGAGDLKIGSRGPAVAAAQRALGIPADGVFGRQTRPRGADVPARARAARRRRDRPGHRRRARHARRRTRAGASRRRWRSSARSASRPTASTARSPAPRSGASRPRAASAVDGVAGPQTLGALGLPANVTLGERGRAAGGGGGGSALAAARSVIGTPYALGGEGPEHVRLLRPDRSGRCARPASRSRARATPSGPSARRSAAPRSRPATSSSSTPTAPARPTSASPRATPPSSPPPPTASREHSISGAYWGAHYLGARRVG